MVGYRPDRRHLTSMKLVTVTVPVARSMIGTQLRRRGGRRCSSSMSMSASQLSRMPARWPAPTTATTFGALSHSSQCGSDVLQHVAASSIIQTLHLGLMRSHSRRARWMRNSVAHMRSVVEGAGNMQLAARETGDALGRQCAQHRHHVLVSLPNERPVQGRELL